MQLSWSDRLPSGPDDAFSGARRLELGGGAWLETVPGWLSGHLELFGLLRASADWEEHRRRMFDRMVTVPRLVASMPGSGLGSRWADEVIVKVQPRSASPRELERSTHLLHWMAALLSKRYQKELAHIALAYYRDGNDSVAFHGDKLGPLRQDTVVAIVSLGARRRFLLRSSTPARSRTNLSFTVGEGDLLVMGGNCQERWEHAVPKATHAGPRIAVMFREPVPSLATARTLAGETNRGQQHREPDSGVVG